MRRQKQVNRQESGSNADGGIGNIKHGPVMVPVVDFNEVDHPAHSHAVYEVSADAAGQQRKRYVQRPVCAGASHQVVDNDYYGSYRYGDQQPLDVAVVQHTEGDSPVLGVAKVQYAPDDDDVAIALQCGCNPVLG